MVETQAPASSGDSTSSAGSSDPLPVPERHYVNGHPLQPPFPTQMTQAVFGLGCFWGAERKFWTQAGVYSTAVGYAGALPQSHV